MTSTPRGLVVATSPEETLAFCARMVNHPGVAWFNPDVPEAPEGYYRLKFPNGGTDPTAPDHFARWRKGKAKPGGDFEIVWVKPDDHEFCFVTGDCVSLVARASGFDRYQPVRGKYLQGGAINCDFMVTDANGKARCFERLARPEPGCIVAYASLADGDHDGERDGAGHTGIVVTVPAEWDEHVRDCWLRLGVVDCASRTPHFADQLSTGRAWFGSRTNEAGKIVPKGSIFCRSIMTP